MMAKRNGAAPTGAQPYRLPKRTVRLIFEDDYEGAEVVCDMSMSYEDFRSMQKGREGEDETESNRRFGDEMLVSWNLHDDDGNLIPATGDEFVRRPVEFMTLIVMKWIEAMTAPLSRTRTPA